MMPHRHLDICRSTTVRWLAQCVVAPLRRSAQIRPSENAAQAGRHTAELTSQARRGGAHEGSCADRLPPVLRGRRGHLGGAGGGVGVPLLDRRPAGAHRRRIRLEPRNDGRRRQPQPGPLRPGGAIRSSSHGAVGSAPRRHRRPGARRGLQRSDGGHDQSVAAVGVVGAVHRDRHRRDGSGIRRDRGEPLVRHAPGLCHRRLLRGHGDRSARGAAGHRPVGRRPRLAGRVPAGRRGGRRRGAARRRPAA